MSDIPIELQRELCAEFRGWAISTSPPRYDGSPCTPYYSDDNKNDYGYVRDYRPDENVQQAAGLKARLRELGYTFCIWHWGHTQDVEVNLHPKDGELQRDIIANARLKTESAALTAAVAQMQAQANCDKGMEDMGFTKANGKDAQ